MTVALILLMVITLTAVGAAAGAQWRRRPSRAPAGAGRVRARDAVGGHLPAPPLFERRVSQPTMPASSRTFFRPASTFRPSGRRRSPGGLPADTAPDDLFAGASRRPRQEVVCLLTGQSTDACGCPEHPRTAKGRP